MYREVETKTFKMLKQQLRDRESGGAAPLSVLDRPVDDRSGYLEAAGTTYQKTFGEN